MVLSAILAFSSSASTTLTFLSLSVFALAGNVADMSATYRPDSQKLAHLADGPPTSRHKFVPDTFFCVGDCRISPNFLKYQRDIRSNHRTNWYV